MDGEPSKIIFNNGASEKERTLGLGNAVKMKIEIERSGRSTTELRGAFRGTRVSGLTVSPFPKIIGFRTYWPAATELGCERRQREGTS